MEKSTPIYTIGYGARSIETFIAVLKKYHIQYLLDVRTSPYSKFNPDFSKEALDHHLKKAGIRYAFFGKLLGGRPNDPDCYRDGLVDYDICRTKAPFRKGLARLRNAWQQQIPIVLMCSEGKPQNCHRSKMIGVGLEEVGIKVMHIDEEGKAKTQFDVMAYVTRNQTDLFWTSPNKKLTSRKKYLSSEEGDEETRH